MRIGLIGASIRSTAVALAATNQLAIGIDWFADQETVDVLGSRSLVARDFKHAKALVMQFSKSPRIRKRRSSANNGYQWILTGGLDLEPGLLSTLTWSGCQILGCGLKAIALAKTAEKWSRQLAKVYPHVPEVRTTAPVGPGVWFRKQNWPEAKSSQFWQKKVEGENRSAIFLATKDGVNLIGVSRQSVTDQTHDAGPYYYLSSEILSPQQFKEDIEDLKKIGQWFAEQEEVIGLFGIDYIKNQHVWPIDINPRVTASVEAIALASGENLLLKHVEAIEELRIAEEAAAAAALEPAQLEQPVDAEEAENESGSNLDGVESEPEMTNQLAEDILSFPLDLTKSVIKRTIYHEGTDLVATEEILDAIQSSLVANDIGALCDIQWADRPKPGTTISAGHPMCTLLISAEVQTCGPADGTLQEVSIKMEQQIRNAICAPIS